MTAPDAGATGGTQDGQGDASQTTESVTRADLKTLEDRMQGIANAMPKRLEALIEQKLKGAAPTSAEPEPQGDPKPPPTPKHDERIANLEATIAASREREKVQALKDTVREFVTKDAVDLAAQDLAHRIKVNDDGSRMVVDVDGVTESYTDDGTRRLTVEDLVKGFVSAKPGLAKKAEPRESIGFKGSAAQVPRTGDGESVEDLRAESNRIELEAQKLEALGTTEALEQGARLRRTAVPLERKISDLRERASTPF